MSAVPTYDCGAHGRLTVTQICEMTGLARSMVHQRIGQGRSGEALVAPQQSLEATWRTRRRTRYTESAARTNGEKLVFVAVQVARFYKDRVPTIEELMRDFDMSRATAYRWRNAFADAMGVTP